MNFYDFVNAYLSGSLDTPIESSSCFCSLLKSLPTSSPLWGLIDSYVVCNLGLS